MAAKAFDLTLEPIENIRRYVPGYDRGRSFDVARERFGNYEAQTVGRFGLGCLLARRFAEAGVRFIEVSTSGWDQHNNLRQQLTRNCESIDQPIAALLNDLDQRGLLDETLVVWGGEFGRTPHVSKPDGRDHNATGYTMWMAGGGVKGGIRHGATDPHGIRAAGGRLRYIHLSESHRGVPGTGTVDWDATFKALAETGFDGDMVIESFVTLPPEIARALSVWRPVADSAEQVLQDGVPFLRDLARRHGLLR